MGVSRDFGTEDLTSRLEKVQKSLWVLSIFLVRFFGQNLLDQNMFMPSDQNVSILFVNNIYWEY